MITKEETIAGSREDIISYFKNIVANNEIETKFLKNCLKREDLTEDEQNQVREGIKYYEFEVAKETMSIDKQFEKIQFMGMVFFLKSIIQDDQITISCEPFNIKIRDMSKYEENK